MFKISQLHGFNKRPVRPLRTITHIGLTVGDAATGVAAPSDIRQGDLLTYHYLTGDDDGTDVPAGFTLLKARFGSGDVASSVSAKIANGTEGGTTISVAPGIAGTAHLRQWRGNEQIRAFSAIQSDQYHETSSNPTISAIAASGGTAPLLVLVIAWTSGAGIPGISMGALDAFDVTASTFLTGYDIQNVGDTLTNISVDTGDGGGANHLGGFYINLS